MPRGRLQPEMGQWRQRRKKVKAKAKAKGRRRGEAKTKERKVMTGVVERPLSCMHLPGKGKGCTSGSGGRGIAKRRGHGS